MSTDDDDFMTFGDGDDEGDNDKPLKLVTGERSVNSIESELKERLHIAELLASSVSIPFVENEDDPDELLSAAATNEIGAIECQPALDTWLPRIAIAHELGPNGTKQEYEAACTALEIDPWPTK